MGIWQFDIYLIPRSKVEERYGELPSSIEDDDFSQINWWAGIAMPDDLEVWAARCLPRNLEAYESWGRFELGTFDGHRISADFQEDEKQIWIRIDVRRSFGDFIRCVVQLASALECCMYHLGDESLIAPDESELIRKIKSSKKFDLFGETLIGER